MPLAITSAAAGSVKCQAAIAKEGGKYAKKKLQGEAKCRQKEATGSCPDAKTAQKIAKAASDAAAKIAKACADDTVQAGLSNSYASLTDDADITSCMLSQHNATADVAVGNSTGLSTEDFPGESNKERGKCVKELSNSGAKYIDKARKIAAKCIDKQMKDGVGGDLVATCVGQYSSGVFTPPSDSKTAASQTNLITKTEAKLAKKCDDAPGYIPSIYACAGATSVADLQDRAQRAPDRRPGAEKDRLICFDEAEIEVVLVDSKGCVALHDGAGDLACVRRRGSIEGSSFKEVCVAIGMIFIPRPQIRMIGDKPNLPGRGEDAMKLLK